MAAKAWRNIALAIAVLSGGCGEATAGGAGGFGSAEEQDDDAATSADTNVSHALDGAAGRAKADLPPEKEKDPDFGAPESSPNYVYIPASGSDRIVKVHGKSLKVTLVEVGDRPTTLRTVPDQDAAIVINAGSDDVAILRSTEAGDTVTYQSILPHSNSLAVAPLGQHAVIWYDHDRNPGELEPVGEFQSVTVLRLAAGKQTSLSVAVGFRVRGVRFSQDGQKAFVITEDGVCVLELAGLHEGQIVAPVPVSKNPLDKPAEREVLITPDAQWAVVRQSGLNGLYAVHLASKKITWIPMTSVPTDLDLVPGASRALAVLRESKEVALVDLPPAATPTLDAKIVSVGDLTAGLARLTDDGNSAILYTSLAGVEQVATLDLATLAVTPVLLRKTVDYVYLPPGARKALLVHKPGNGPNHDDPVEAFVDKGEGYTLYDLDTGFTKLVMTPVRLTGIATSDTTAGQKAWILLPDPAGLQHSVQEAEIKTFTTLSTNLGSKPEHVRFLPQAGAVAVTQDHPSGRITFVNVLTGEAKTVTGFELNGMVK